MVFSVTAAQESYLVRTLTMMIVHSAFISSLLYNLLICVWHVQFLRFICFNMCSIVLYCLICMCSCCLLWGNKRYLKNDNNYSYSLHGTL